MRSVVLDKIGSVTLNCRLNREVKVADTYPCREGDVVAVRIRTRKSTYNQLELVTGRFSDLKPGDVIAGALGHRRAVCGYAGHVPEKLETGDTIHVLNLGGVLGICDSINPKVGAPFECEVLGQVLHFPILGERVGIAANIAQGAEPMARRLEVPGVPVIAVVGTAMNAGKTSACSSLIQELTRRGLSVAGAKATGVSLRRDILAMEDAGARAVAMFTDFGVVSTSRKNAADLTRTMLSRLAATRPQVIVLELGDGMMGDYGVDAILESSDIRAAFTAVVLCANDTVGAWGGVQRLKNEYGLATTVVTGPATDNAAGTDVIRRQVGAPALNALVSAPALADCVMESKSVSFSETSTLGASA